MPLRFSVGIESLEEENLIFSTGLKETLKTHRGKNLKIF